MHGAEFRTQESLRVRFTYSRLRTAIARSLPWLPLGWILFACAACAGGPAALFQIPPPPDFALALSSNSLSVTQGTASAPVSVSVTPQNGFNASVQVTLNGLPSGVSSNPVSPFTLASNASASIVFTADANANTGNFTISARGDSGSLSQSASLALTVQPGVASTLPRTTYARTDAIPAFDNPADEPRHRRIAYDPTTKHIFVANSAMNRVEVFSTTNQSRVAQINVPAVTSVDLSPDASTLWVGTLTEEAAAIDIPSLQVKSRIAVPAISTGADAVFTRPEELLALANGKLMMRLRQPNGIQSVLALWDPSANTATNLSPTASQLFANGLGAIARTGDHAKLIVAASDATGEVAIFDSTGSLIIGPHGLGTGQIPAIAANPDGSYFALAFTANSATQLMLLDNALNPVAQQSSASIHGLAFSRDGRFLYVTTAAPSLVTVFDGTTLQPLGQVPDPAIRGISTEIEEADETKLLFGVANRGVSFIDAAGFAPLPATAPSFSAAPSAQPSEGPSTGGTSVSLGGQNFESTAQVTFGAQLAADVSVTNATLIQTVSPLSAIGASVNISAYFPSGWLTLAPDAFSYGPQILKILPNAGSISGGDSVQIYGYGFGSDATKITASFGSSSAPAQSVEDVSAIAPALALGSTYPFPLECITVQAPPGNPGWVSVSVHSPAGSAALANAFQYFSAKVYSQPSSSNFLLYDQQRQWIYLSSIDHVSVFDLSTQQFHSTSLYPPGIPPPNSGFRGLALAPGGTRLVVADFGAQSVYLLDPDTSGGTIVPVGGVPGFLNSGPARVAPTSAQTVFVGLSGEGGSSGTCASCLLQLNTAVDPPTVQSAPQPQVTSLTGAPLVQANAAGDRVIVAYDSPTGGPFGLWSASSPNQFTISLTSESAIDLGVSSDGSSFATRTSAGTEIRGTDLTLGAIPSIAELENIPGRVFVPEVTLHPAGALLYQPFLTGSPAPRAGLDIVDTHSGQLRLRLFLPEQFAMTSTDTDGLHGRFLAVDETGQRIFALTVSGLTIVQLGEVPLGIGTVSPSSASASGGTALTIRGSGFQSGSTVKIGGKTTGVTFKDMSTLTVVTPAVSVGAQQITVTNPDGQTVRLDAAFIAN